MIAVDTNVLLRYLIEPIDANNPSWQASKARKIINSAESVFICDIVIAETEWVLESVFKFTKNEIAELIGDILSNSKFMYENWSVLQCALLDYKENNKVELSDYVIARRANYNGSKTLYTFENSKKLGRLDITTILTKNSTGNEL